MYTPVNPGFTIYKWGLRGSKLYRHVFVMHSSIMMMLYITVVSVKTLSNGSHFLIAGHLLSINLYKAVRNFSGQRLPFLRKLSLIPPFTFC